MSDVTHILDAIPVSCLSQDKDVAVRTGDTIPVTVASELRHSLVVFKIDEQEFAVGISAVERVVRAVEIAPLPDAPHGVRGVINFQGRILPVFDLRAHCGLPPRELRLSDHLLIARTRWRTVAFIVDSVVGVVSGNQVEITATAEILADVRLVSGIMKGNGGMVLVYDLERFLSIQDHETLRTVLDS